MPWLEPSNHHLQPNHLTFQFLHHILPEGPAGSSPHLLIFLLFPRLFLQGDLDPLDILNTLIDEGQDEFLPRAGVKCSECPCPESAILITGCGSDQLSEDTGEGSALTLALVEVLQSFKETYPDQDISYRWVMSKALNYLACC